MQARRVNFALVVNVVNRNGKRLADVRCLIEKELRQMIELHKVTVSENDGDCRTDSRSLLTENIERLNASSSRGCFQLGQVSAKNIYQFDGVVKFMLSNV